MKCNCCGDKPSLLGSILVAKGASDSVGVLSAMFVVKAKCITVSYFPNDMVSYPRLPLCQGFIPMFVRSELKRDCCHHRKSAAQHPNESPSLLVPSRKGLN